MKLLIVLELVATMTSASLLDMSQVLWSRVLDGGYRKVGKVDPLLVPVVKVDQSEGNTSYRVILRNLRVTGLNASTIESVHVVRGKLKSNLSDSEAGYVSYNEQKGMDSIRYRFHTLVKEPKGQSSEVEQRATEQFERIVQFDPIATRVNGEQEDLLKSGQRMRSGVRQEQGEDRIYNFGDMRVVMNSTPRNPSQVRVVYTNNYANQQASNVRPCIGACRPSYLLQQQKQQQQNVRTRVDQNQRYADRVADTQESSTASPKGAGDSGMQFSGSFGNGRFSVESQATGSTLAPAASGPGLLYSGNLGNSRFSVNGQSGQIANPGERVKGGSEYSGSFGNNRFSVNSQTVAPGEQPPAQFFGGSPYGGQEENTATTGSYEATAQYAGATSDVRGGNNPPVYYAGDMPAGTTLDGFTGQPVEYADPEYRYLCESQQDSRPLHFESGLRSRIGKEPTTPLFDQFEPYKAPMVRIEKQPGFVDIVYAGDRKQTSESRKVENLDAGFMEIIKDLSGNQRYVIHNFTEGESLRRRNDAIRVAAESKRIKDLLRYAKDYQEQQGYFEEGMELIYHFGDLNKTANETLARRKRQQSNDTEEEDVMHVIARLRVPKLNVKANYALLAQVGKQPMRGAGLLDGNFTDVTADFTVELKKVDNKTMVVRAARAKLVSKDRGIKLQGMDENGPVSRILSHGLMAAEAVAAMIADDLASKALNEDNNEAMIYKMYKNLPVVEKP
ncbi:hypothetical protein TSAR_013134 [Trichomalopsis sarcophagae]|uniref:Vitellogenin domain-containing protein n=1 Tax=Trichomalopsis sarcophagae TaxID=543379 RepID=A0A232FIU2_9HYME|nr:hypothetical protein TSAR_013134 [Trichomalopsis sarcophagae]